MGTGNVIGPYTCIGLNGEIRGVKVFNGTVELGSDNVISEHVTIQRPELGVTKVGDRNIIMAHAHIGHDAIVGSDCEICTTSVIGGYVCIEDKVKVKLHSVIRNRITLGEGCLVGMGSVVVKSVEKGQVVMGNPARVKQE